ncbi:hypothetical protein BC835DRAFT_998797 [Cytidiella melzeri]|nr:hypothetical protein BC835DRAFT_998797 [Cytidiella melzeri]
MFGDAGFLWVCVYRARSFSLAFYRRELCTPAALIACPGQAGAHCHDRCHQHQPLEHIQHCGGKPVCHHLKYKGLTCGSPDFHFQSSAEYSRRRLKTCSWKNGHTFASVIPIISALASRDELHKEDLREQEHNDGRYSMLVSAARSNTRTTAVKRVPVKPNV